MNCRECRNGKVVTTDNDRAFDGTYGYIEVPCEDCHGTGHYELCECGVVLEEGHVCEAA